jgi:uncharacterized protein (DUF433 family)
MAESIVRDGETGRAIVSSTGTPVDDILEAIESSGTVAGALRLHPGLTPEGVAAALQFARVAVRREVKYAPEARFGVSQVREVALREYGHADDEGGTMTLEPENGVFGTLSALDHKRERLRYELDLIDSLHAGLEDVAAGRTLSHEDAIAWLRSRIPG